MNAIDLKDKSVEELVDRFVAIMLHQEKAIFDDDTQEYNLLYQKMASLIDELKNRTGDQRHALIPLLAHRSAQVRLMAAIATLALAPDAARAALQQISDRNEYPQAAYARGMMRALDRGHVPT
jgi:hypothetical protein